MQVLNVFLGGTLIQDLQPEWQALHQGEEDVYHSIRCCSGSLLERLLGPCPTVNSAHHQAVDRWVGGLRQRPGRRKDLQKESSTAACLSWVYSFIRNACPDRDGERAVPCLSG